MKRTPHAFLALIVLAFAVVQLQTCAQKGDRPLRRLDAQSEANSSSGAQHFLQDGFLVTSFLARYDTPLNLDSGSAVIRESDVYTHYFPGPDYVLAFSYAIFGAGPEVFRLTRVLPLVHLLGAVLLFLVLAERRLWPGRAGITACVALLLLFPPVLSDWALSLHGHAYSSSYVLLGLCLGLAAEKGRHRTWKIAGAFALGFLSNYMLLTAAFVVCAAPLSGSLLVPERESHRFAFLLSVLVGIGLVTAFGLHFLQVASLFGWAETRLDQFGVLAVRAGAGEAGTSLSDLFSQYQADVTRFFGLSPLVMLLIGLWGASCHPGSRRGRLHLGLAIVLAFASSWAWIFLMRQHSLQHGHVNPRIFLLVYVCALASAGTLGAACRTSKDPV